MAAVVPAWKRLGLKLKYAKDEADQTQQNQKRIDPDLSERPAKRQRTSNGENQSANGVHSHVKGQSYANGQVPAKESFSNARRQPIRKKSVTFSDDTKVDDGDSRVTIDFPEGSPSSTPKKHKSTVTKNGILAHSPSEIDNGGESATPLKTKKTKTMGGKKTKKFSSGAKDKSTLALDYLSQHRTDRETWKFNKNRDVWILQNALSTEAIPQTHTLALAGYVEGLPREAGARQRLVDQSKTAFKDSSFTLDQNGSEKDVFQGWLDGSSTPKDDAELVEFFSRVPRSLALLWALGERNFTAADRRNGAAVKMDSVALAPLKKKKAMTTAIVDVSSSESDSNSDSSDDSSEAKASKAKGSTMKDAANGHEHEHGEETSSSGSESDSDSVSSSSESDSESS